MAFLGDELKVGMAGSTAAVQGKMRQEWARNAPELHEPSGVRRLSRHVDQA
jgi:hypothetical protein